MRHSRRSRDGYAGKLWLDFDEVHWFSHDRRREDEGTAPAVAAEPPAFVLSRTPVFAPAGPSSVFAPVAAPPLRLRRPDWSRERRRRLLTRFVPTIAVGVAAGTAAVWLVAGAPGLRAGDLPQARTAQPAATAPVTPVVRTEAVPAFGALAQASAGAPTAASEATPVPEIQWHSSKALGLPHAGRLVGGVQLPTAGPGWVTWDPVRDRSPNRAGRLWGTDGLIRTALTVIDDYRAAHPNAPALVIGDISRRSGGAIDDHASHENGLDIDIYYPRRDGKLRPASRVAQIDHRLAQDLVDRFVAAGAQVLFVGQHVHLHGPSGVVVPYPNHDDHVHVRFAPSHA